MLYSKIAREVARKVSYCAFSEFKRPACLDKSINFYFVERIVSVATVNDQTI